MKNTINAALPGILMAALVPSTAHAIHIVVDYSYDTNSFFSDPVRRAALEAAADRYSTVITSSLLGVLPGPTGTGTSDAWRIGFTHPGTGVSYQISTAGDVGSDWFEAAGAGAADEYGFSGLAANQWTLFAGGRSMSAAGVGGTSTGTNTLGTADDIYGPLHRGFEDNTTGSSFSDLPRWGGAIAFNTGLSWHADLATTASGGTNDLYSVALHEIGHALGLSSSWNQWQDDGSGNYLGMEGINAYNEDHLTALTSLNLESAANAHWADGIYDSVLFPGGATVGTVGEGNMQDLLMEPVLDFGGAQQRMELTRVDVAALQDLGWSVIPEPSVLLLAGLGLTILVCRRER